MRRALLVGLAFALSACGEAPGTTSPDSEVPSWGTAESDATPGAPRFGISAPAPVTPRVTTLPAGSWVRDELGSCVEREDWFVIGSGGLLDRVLASRGSCGTPSVSRYVGHWSTDQQTANLEWANRDESVERETTFWANGQELQLGAYVPVDGGWHRREVVQRDVAGRKSSSTVDVGLRIDSMSLEDGARCGMSATVAVEIDGNAATETFEFECLVSARGDGFVVAADGMWSDGGWHDYLRRRGTWDTHGVRLGNAIYEGFQPVLVTTNGEALWHERANSVYRWSPDSPPLTTAELGD